MTDQSQRVQTSFKLATELMQILPKTPMPDDELQEFISKLKRGLEFVNRHEKCKATLDTFERSLNGQFTLIDVSKKGMRIEANYSYLFQTQNVDFKNLYSPDSLTVIEKQIATAKQKKREIIDSINNTITDLNNRELIFLTLSSADYVHLLKDNCIYNKEDKIQHITLKKEKILTQITHKAISQLEMSGCDFKLNNLSINLRWTELQDEILEQFRMIEVAMADVERLVPEND